MISDIEVLRSFAILFTLVYHGSTLFIWPNAVHTRLTSLFVLWTGVDLFFVISGFVIARQLLPKLAAVGDWRSFWRVSGEFWIRRAFRILPGAWFWLAIGLGLNFALGDAYANLSTSLSETAAAVLQYANVHHWRELNLWASSGGTAGPYWSLSLEEQFYLLFPFLAFCGRKRFSLIVLSLITVQFFIPRAPNYLLWDFRLDAFLVGVAIFLLSKGEVYAAIEPTYLEKTRHRRFTICGLLVLLAYTAKFRYPFYTGVVAQLAGALVWIASYDKSYLCRGPRLKALFMWIGTRSFALYLAHTPLFLLNRYIYLHVIGLDHPGPVMALIPALSGLALVIVAAELSYRLIEVPLRNYGKRLARTISTRPDEKLAAEPASAAT